MPAGVTISALDSALYSTSYGKVLSSYSNPVCPTSSVGTPQVYNPQNGQCVNIPASKVVAQGASPAACNGDPFMTEINGQCYSTNSCPSSSYLTSSCLNTQHVPYQQNPLSGPGVLSSSMYK